QSRAIYPERGLLTQFLIENDCACSTPIFFIQTAGLGGITTTTPFPRRRNTWGTLCLHRFGKAVQQKVLAFTHITRCRDLPALLLTRCPRRRPESHLVYKKCTFSVNEAPSI